MVNTLANSTNSKNIIYSKIFILLSSLSKNLMGMFNLIYLYNHGFSLVELALWQLIVHLCYLILQPLSLKFSYKFSNKILISMSLLFFILTYTQLIFSLNSFIDLILNAILFTTYATFYWNLKHSLEFNTLDDKKVGKKVGIILIIGQVAEILSSLISSFILDYFSIIPLFITSSIFMIIAVIYVFKIDEKRKKKPKGSLLTYFKVVPKTTLFHMFLRETSTVMGNFFSIYLYIYVSNTYSFAGFTNFLLGLASIIFIYFISNKIDKKRESYLLLSTILLCLVYLFKINITTEVVLVVVFLEGFIKQFFSIVSNNNYYLLGYDLDKTTYICSNAFFLNASRAIIFVIGFFLTGSLPKLMYFCIGLLVLSGFVPFKINKKVL